MDSAKFLAVIIGIIGALAGVYLREALRKANERLKAATYIESNLRHWLKVGLENEHLKEFLLTGYIWSEKKRETIKTGNIQEVLKLSEEFKTILSSIRDHSEELKEKLQDSIRGMKPFKKEEFSEIIKELDRRINSLEEGDGLIRSSDLACLDWFMLPVILEVRSELISILVSLKLVLTHLSVRETVDEKFLLNQVLSCVDSGLKVSVHIVPLLKYAETIRKKGVWGNIFI